jgi:hypothetical protein
MECRERVPLRGEGSAEPGELGDDRHVGHSLEVDPGDEPVGASGTGFLEAGEVVQRGGVGSHHHVQAGAREQALEQVVA